MRFIKKYYYFNRLFDWTFYEIVIFDVFKEEARR